MPASPIVKIEEYPESLLVSEIFYSIQGESSFAGYPCLFIRLAGCNLRCTYCDARYTYEEEGERKTLDELLTAAEEYPQALVEITGGEPLLQERVYPLMDRLLKEGRTVLLETNGSVSLERVPAGVVKIMDLKCPDSGMEEKMDWHNLNHLTPEDEIKFVLSSRRDYEWAGQKIKEHALAQTAKLIFSPVVTRLAPADLAGWVLADGLPVRLQLQLHTILWPGKRRGV